MSKSKIDILKFKKTSNGLVPYDSEGNKISVRNLLKSGGLNYNNNSSNLSVLNTNSGKFSYFYGSKLDYLSVKKDKSYISKINSSSVHKKSSNLSIKSTNAPYMLLRVHKYKTDKGVIRDYKYILKEKSTGNIIELEKKNVEIFFENKNWDGKDRSKRLLGGSGALVDGLIESYYAKDDTWHLRVNKNAEVIIDDGYNKSGKVNTVKDTYTLTEVYAKTITTVNGKHKLEKYAYVLLNNRTNESDFYTRDQLFNLFYDSSKSASELYDNSRLINATIQYHKNSSGIESYRIRVAEKKVIWHIDEDIRNNDLIVKYVCTKVFRVKVPTKTGDFKNHYVEFEMLGLTEDDIDNFKNGDYSVDELVSGETFIVTGADLVSLTEILGAKEYPFYDSSKLDNLKLKNKKSSTIYDKQAEIEIYKAGGLPSTSMSKLEPVVVDLDYDTWKKAHEEHVAKIEKFIKNNEDKAINTVITWNEVLSNSLSDEDIHIQNSTFIDFWKNRLSAMCRIYTLPINNESNENTMVFDIMTPDINDENHFVVKESRTNDSMKSVSIRKYTLEGDEPDDVYEALGRNWVRFLNCIANSMNRKLVLVLGKCNNKNYIITCANEEIQKKVIGNKEVYYIPFIWYEEFTVKVRAVNNEIAEKMVYNVLNNKINHPKKELRSVVKSSIKLDKKLLESMKKKNTTKIRPDIITNDDYKVKYADVDSDIFNTDDGVEIIQKEEKLNIYKVKVEIANRGYMAVDATSENEAYTLKLSEIKDGTLEFKPISDYIPDSIKILSCELIEEYEKDLNNDISLINFGDKSWDELDVGEENTIKLDLSNSLKNDNVDTYDSFKDKLFKYKCEASYKHDNQSFAEEEIKLQIDSALKDIFYILEDFSCVSSDFVGDEDFTDDYLFNFEFTVLASPGLDMNSFISSVDGGACLEKLSIDNISDTDVRLTKEILDKQLIDVLNDRNKTKINSVFSDRVEYIINEIETTSSWRFYNFDFGPAFVNIDGFTLEDYNNKDIFVYSDGVLVDALLYRMDEFENAFKKIDNCLFLFESVYLTKEDLEYVKYSYLYQKFKDNFIKFDNFKWYLNDNKFKLNGNFDDILRLKLIDVNFTYSLDSLSLISTLDMDESYLSILNLYSNPAIQCYLDSLYTLKESNKSIYEENKDYIGFDIERKSSGNYLLSFNFKENGLDYYIYLGDIDDEAKNYIVFANDSDSLYYMLDNSDKYLFKYKLDEIKNRLSSSSLYDMVNYLSLLVNENNNVDDSNINEVSYPVFSRDSLKFNFFDNKRKLAGIPYTVVQLFDILLSEDNTLDNYDTVNTFFKKYNVSNINDIFDKLNSSIISNDELSIVYSNDEIQINKVFIDCEVKVLMSLRLNKGTIIKNFKVEANGLKNYSSRNISNYLHLFCDDVLDYLDTVLNKSSDIINNELSFDDIANYSESDSIVKSMFIDKPACIEISENGRFKVLTDDETYIAPTVKSFAQICMKGYDKIYAKKEVITSDEVKLINNYPQILYSEINDNMKYTITEDGLLIEEFYRLNNKKENLNNILVEFKALFNNKTNELDVSIVTDNMRILVYFRDKWLEFDNNFKNIMEKSLPQISIINTMYNDIENLKLLGVNTESLETFIGEFINTTLEQDAIIDDNILDEWRNFINSLETNYNEFNTNKFDNLNELEEIMDVSFESDINNLGFLNFESNDNMSDDDLMSLFNSLGTVELDDSYSDNMIPVIQENTNNENTLLENIEKLDEINQIEVDTMIFLTVFDNLLNIIDSSYDSGSVSVIEDEFIISENNQEYKTSIETINRLKKLLITENVIKLSNIYIKLLDSILNKGVLETIVSEAQTFAVLNNMFEKYGNDMINYSYRNDTSIVGIPSAEILAETLKDSGIDSNKFEFLNGVVKK